jgi:hypothetical protein
VGGKKSVKADDRKGQNAQEPDLEYPGLFETRNYQYRQRKPERQDLIGGSTQPVASKTSRTLKQPFITIAPV